MCYPKKAIKGLGSQKNEGGKKKGDPTTNSHQLFAGYELGDFLRLSATGLGTLKKA